jgi:hypothetical protein
VPRALRRDSGSLGTTTPLYSLNCREGVYSRKLKAYEEPGLLHLGS